MLLAGCTANREMQLSPTPDGLATYLQTSHPRDLQVTDTAGQQFWLHRPKLVGDSLVGLPDWNRSASRRAIPVAAIGSVAEPRFSAGRTIGLVGGILGSAGIALIIVASSGPEPVY